MLSVHGTNPTLDLAKLVGRATAAASKFSTTPTDGDLASVVDAIEQRTRALLAVRSVLRHELACGTPPPALIAALGRPQGTPCRIRLAIHGQSALVVVHPLGAASLERAAKVWQSLTGYVHAHNQAA